MGEIKVVGEKLFPKAYEGELNRSFYWVYDFEGEEPRELVLTGSDDYCVFLNGALIHYGPARASIHHYRLDKISLAPLEEKNRLVIVLASYNCISYTRPNEPSFLLAEVHQGEKVEATTKDFACYLDTTRYQKVVRFSYQREFSESYKTSTEIQNALKSFGKPLPLPKVKTSPVQEGVLEERHVHYSDFSADCPFSLLESGFSEFDTSLKEYDDRYMHATFLKIFEKKDWEIDPNGYISRLRFHRFQSTSHLRQNEFSTYGYDVCKTGFLYLGVRVREEAKLYLVFEETDTRKEGEDVIGITFYRNTTHNIVSYELTPGDYHLITREPYTAKFIRVVVEKGEVEVEKVGIVPFENPDVGRFHFSFANPKIQKIVEAGVNTFAQNAVDILTDCPSRERAGWLCDTYFSGVVENVLTGENLVERNFLENYSQYENQGDQPVGMIPMCYPCDYGDHGYIPNWGMFYILEIKRYVDRHGDRSVAEAAKGQLYAFLDWCKRYVNSDGLLENLDGTILLEWSHASDMASTEGVNYPTNALFAAALEAMGEMYGDKALLERSASMKKIIEQQAYDGTFFEDNAVRKDGKLTLTGRISETTQYYLFYFGVASAKRYPKLYRTLIQKLGPTRDPNKTLPNVFPSNMFIGDYLRLMVLLQNGSFEQVADETVDYFYFMAERTGTVWEFDSTYASLTHCFASYVILILMEIYAGIVAIDEKDKRVVLSSREPIRDGDFSLEVPTKDGYVKASRKGEDFDLSIPSGWLVVLDH